MRTTLSLDSDVADLLKRAQKIRKASLKTVVNDAMRQGLKDLLGPSARPKKPFRTTSVSLGRCLVCSLDDVAEVLATAEGEAWISGLGSDQWFRVRHDY
jgi:hypothetical protein